MAFFLFFREKLLRKPALSPALLEGAVGSSGCRMRMTNVDKETAAQGTLRTAAFFSLEAQIRPPMRRMTPIF